MSNAEKLRETMSLIEAVKSQISMTTVYVENEERWLHEMRREEEKLKRQQERVERLRYQHDCGAELLLYYSERLTELKAEAAALRNAVKVERMRELFAQANALEGALTEETLDSLRRNFGMGESSGGATYEAE